MKSQLPQLKPRVQLPSIAGKRRKTVVPDDAGYSFWRVHQFTGVSFGVSSEESNAKDMAFSTDGTRMFIVGTGADSVHQYDLTIPFDVSAGSISYSGVSFLLSGQDSSPFGVSFSTDGTIMFMVGTLNDTLYRYDLTTPFDISGGSISYSGVSFSLSSQDTFPVGVSFSTDGTIMFMAGKTNARVYQYDLSIPFDISGGSISYSGISFLLSGQEPAILGIDFTADGSRMYVVGSDFNTLFQYKLSIPFDVSGGSISYTGAALTLSDENSGANATRFSTDGRRMFMLGGAGEIVYQYEIEG